jgi:hypothetical protein
MMRVKWRWLLPFGHGLVDCILLVALIAYSNRMFRREKGPLHGPRAIQPALFLQESSSIGWDPKTDPSGQFMLLLTGNVPAGLISEALRPQAGMVSRERRWDPVWFLLHEAFAFSCWYLIGAWIDAGRFSLRKIMSGYLALRFLMAFTGVYDAGWRIQVLFWLSLTLWLVGLGSSYLLRAGSRAAKRA